MDTEKYALSYKSLISRRAIAFEQEELGRAIAETSDSIKVVLSTVPTSTYIS